MGELVRKIDEAKKELDSRIKLVGLEWPSTVRDLIETAYDNVAWSAVADAMMESGYALLGETLNVLIRNGVDVRPRRVVAAIVMCRRMGDEPTKALAPKPVDVVWVDEASNLAYPFDRHAGGFQSVASTMLNMLDFAKAGVSTQEFARSVSAATARLLDEGHLFNLIRYHAYGRPSPDGVFRADRIPSHLADEFARRRYPFPLEQLANRGEAYRVRKDADTQE